MQIKGVTIASMWIIAFVFGMANLCLGQSYWKKKIGGDGESVFSAIQPTSGGNFLIVGSKYADSGDRRGWLLKIKPNGDTLWTKTFGGAQPKCFSSIQPTSDGNYLIAGDDWLLKINPNGDTIWTKTFGGIDITTIQSTADDNFLILGETGVLDGWPDGWLLKIKPNGDSLWTKTYSGAGYDYLSAIQLTTDGNFLIAGFTSPNPSKAGQKGWLIKVKPNGDTLWMKTYGGTGYDCFSAIQPAIDGNFLIAGYTYPYAGGAYGCLVRIKPNGDTLWTKTFRGSSFYAIQPTTDGNYLIADRGGAYGCLVKIKPNGDTLWTKNTYDNSISGSNMVIQPTSDDNFLLAVSEPLKSYIMCIIADQYANKNTLFTYKIPVYSPDTLNFGYVPLKVPSGMTVSTGGTVSWTPKNDSVYMDHAEFLVLDDTGKKDTLTFNVFVNSACQQPIVIKSTRTSNSEPKPFEILTTAQSGRVKLSVPSFVKTLTIYDMNGKLIGKAAPVVFGSVACVVWPSASSSSSEIPSGRYIVKASEGKNTVAKPFLLVR